MTLNMTGTFDVENFEADVLERSKHVPVLVDFWADWCGPCRVLGPVLEGMAREEEAFANPRWKLAKVDTERFTDVAARYGVRGIPNVKLFHHGNVIDEFAGALPEQQVRTWLESALPDPNSEQLMEAERLIKSGQTEAAVAIVDEILESDPGNRLARLLKAESIATNDPEEAAGMVQDIREDSDLFARAEGLRVLAEIKKILDNEDDLPESEARAPFTRAGRAALNGDFDTALEQFIKAIRADRYFADDMARKACIAIFKFLGEQDVDRSLY
jgi:putative thioredoxin